MVQPSPQPMAASAPTAMFDERIIDLKLAAVEARTETNFAKLIGKLDLLGDRLGAIGKDVGDLKTSIGTLESKTNNTRVIIVTTVIAAVISIVSVTYGIIGYGHQVADTISAAFAAGQAAK